MVKILVSFAAPMLILAFALAYQRRTREPTIGRRGIESVDGRRATAPRLAGALLVVSLVLLGAAGAMTLLGAR